MESQAPSLTWLLLSFFALLLILMRRRSAKTIKIQNKVSKLPPGPSQLPIIGSIHHLLGGSARSLHITLRDMAKKHGPLMLLKLGQVNTIVITSAETAKEVFKTHDLIFFSRAPLNFGKIISYGNADIVFSPYGSYWRDLRKICTLELLSAKRIRSFRVVREGEVSNLVHSISQTVGSPVNLTDKFFLLSNSIIAGATIGMKCKQQERIMEGIREIVNVAKEVNLADLFPSLKFLDVVTGLKTRLDNIHQLVDRVLDDIIKEHQVKNPKVLYSSQEGGEEEPEDLVDVLLRLQKSWDLENPLTTNSIKAVILDMFVAGTETSANILEWSMLELIRNPKTMEKTQDEVRKAFEGKEKIIDEGVFDELNYLKLVIKESLRLHPPVPMLFPRESSQRCVINGYEIPAKSRVFINVWAIGRDPQAWSNPEQFSPERFEGSSTDYRGANFEFIPFSAGRRICPGILFGVTNVEYTLAQLLYHFNWKQPDGVDLKDFSLDGGEKSKLFLQATPYTPQIY